MGGFGIALVPTAYAGAPLTMTATAERGNSLIEVLTSTLFLAILMAMSYSFARAALISARVHEVKSEAQELAVMTLDVVTRELRMAGFSAAGRPLTAVTIAAAERVEVASDFNGDGDTADANETIAYSYNARDREIMRATSGGSPQPLARNVPPQGLRFRYLDRDGHDLVPGSGGLSPTERRQVRRIDVLFHVELYNPNPHAATPLSATASTSVCLRNP